MENNKFHILIVDDDNRIRDLLKDYLINNNYIISTAENAGEAKEKLKYVIYYFPSIIFFKTFLNLITESELEFFKALNILFF